MKLIKQINSLYRQAPFWQRMHIALRYFLCPFDAVEKFVPEQGKILDLGCGHGIFANILHLGSAKRAITGVDCSAQRVNTANMSRGPETGIRFKTAQAASYIPDEQPDCVTLIDLPLETDPGLLKKIHAFLAPGGFLLIKSICRRPLWKYYLALLHMATIDRLMRLSLRPESYFLPEEKFIGLLTGTGFKVDFIKIDKHYPCAHCLYVCRKD